MEKEVKLICSKKGFCVSKKCFEEEEVRLFKSDKWNVWEPCTWLVWRVTQQKNPTPIHKLR